MSPVVVIGRVLNGVVVSTTVEGTAVVVAGRV